MAEEGKSWWGKFGPFGRGDLATQAAVLLPVMAIAVLSAWTMGARGQSVEPVASNGSCGAGHIVRLIRRPSRPSRMPRRRLPRRRRSMA